MIVESYSAAQLEGLKVGLLAAGGIALASLWLTGRLPSTKLTAESVPTAEDMAPRLERSSGDVRAS